MKKAIASLVLGIGIFIFAIFIMQPQPLLLQTEDSAINAGYDAPPLVQFKTANNICENLCSNATRGCCTLAEVTVGGRAVTGKAHVARGTSADSETAQTSASHAELTFGQFSTAEAMGYHTMGYHSHVPNPHYVQGQVNIASHPSHAK